MELDSPEEPYPLRHSVMGADRVDDIVGFLLRKLGENGQADGFLTGTFRVGKTARLITEGAERFLQVQGHGVKLADPDACFGKPGMQRRFVLRHRGILVPAGGQVCRLMLRKPKGSIL